MTILSSDEESASTSSPDSILIKSQDVQSTQDAQLQVVKTDSSPGSHTRNMEAPTEVSFGSKSIRVGSLKGTPLERVIMTPTGINIKMECRSLTLNYWF